LLKIWHEIRKELAEFIKKVVLPGVIPELQLLEIQREEFF